MTLIRDITVKTKIYESANSLVYRGVLKSDKTAVILKVLKQDYPTRAEITRYKQEYEIIRSFNLEGVIKAYSQQNDQRTLAIVLEDFGGESLHKWMKELPSAYCPMTVPNFLHIAIKITEILSRIHADHIIHKDINPSNIVLNPETGILKIIDFGIATRLSLTNPTFKNLNVIEGTITHISPEQTGRMNRLLDYRTDFYSLGVTCYELLTGQLPFTTTDVLELVHCHIAKQPLPPHQVISQIPKAVSALVMKLMAKNAEERYQTARGLLADLEECRRQLETTGRIEEFPLGLNDISDKFQIPQKLYGREAELQTLLAAFVRVASPEDIRVTAEGVESSVGQASRLPSGVGVDSTQFPHSIEMMLVAGYSGIGKSALVQEIYKPITEKRGYFISGKFDQFRRNIPYSAIVGAFAGLIRQLLTESESQLQQWREKLLVALGINGQVITDVIPEVELIIGKQPPVPDMGPIESQNRFHRVFQNFIQVFSSKEHPLVIFLDDLQWVDSATLKLIELIMTSADMQYLFLIGAYRDNEVETKQGASLHPLIMTVEKLRKQGATINSITLAPLTLEPMTQLIAETLHINTSKVKPLAELVMRKTGGNPFFVNEFLKTLYLENLITFNYDALGAPHG